MNPLSSPTTDTEGSGPIRQPLAAQHWLLAVVAQQPASQEVDFHGRSFDSVCFGYSAPWRHATERNLDEGEQELLFLFLVVARQPDAPVVDFRITTARGHAKFSQRLNLREAKRSRISAVRRG